MADGKIVSILAHASYSYSRFCSLVVSPHQSQRNQRNHLAGTERVLFSLSAGIIKGAERARRVCSALQFYFKKKFRPALISLAHLIRNSLIESQTKIHPISFSFLFFFHRVIHFANDPCGLLICVNAVPKIPVKPLFYRRSLCLSSGERVGRQRGRNRC